MSAACAPPVKSCVFSKAMSDVGGGWRIGQDAYYSRRPACDVPGSGDRFTYGYGALALGEIAGAATIAQAVGKGVRVFFSGNKKSGTCFFDQLSRTAHSHRPHLRAATVSEISSNTRGSGDNYTWPEDGITRVVKGWRGEVVGQQPGQVPRPSQLNSARTRTVSHCGAAAAAAATPP